MAFSPARESRRQDISRGEHDSLAIPMSQMHGRTKYAPIQDSENTDGREDMQHLHPKYDSPMPTQHLISQPSTSKHRVDKQDTGTFFLVFKVITQFLSILIPLAFIALAIMAARLDNSDISSYGESIMRVARVSPTIYPIVFAAIVANFMKAVALWLAQKTARLGTLEQLCSSQSISSALTIAVSLRVYGPLKLLVVVLWALSPVGGQSALRILSIGPHNITSERLLNYTSGEDVNYYGSIQAHYLTTPIAIQAAFRSTLLSANASKLSPMDPWGNIKVPAVNSANLSTNWTSFNATDVNDYSSLVGIPVWNGPSVDDHMSNYTMEWSYANASCSPPQNASLITWCNVSSTSINVGCYFEGNETSSPVYVYEDDMLWSDWNGTLFNATNAPEYLHIQYYFSPASKSRDGLAYNCTVSSVRLELQVDCHGDTCAVIAYRQSQQDQRPDFLTFWNSWYPTNGLGPAAAFFGNLVALPNVTGFAQFGYATPLDFYLFGRNDPFSQAGGYLELQDAPAGIFDIRFTQALNMYWQLSQGVYGITGGIQTIGPNVITGRPQYRNATLNITQIVTVYKSSKLWITLLIVVSIILELCAVASFLLGYLTIAPDIFGYVSSLTRDSPYFSDVKDRSTSKMNDGAALARQLKGLQVQIADVEPTESVGRVAFVPSRRSGAGSGEDTALLQRNRKYT